MLAFGIGATTAIFSIVEGVLLRPLPFPDPARLVVLADKLQGANLDGSGEAGTTAPDIRAYTRGTHSFDSLGGYTSAAYELSGIGEPAQVNAAKLTSGVLPALAVAPLLGRVFTAQEDEQGQQLAILSYATWQHRFQANPQILGSKILLDRKPYVVIGVMPVNFEFPLAPGHLNRSELWVPVSFTQQDLTQGAASWNYQMVGRLKSGVTAAQAQADAERVAQEIMRGYPPFMASLRISSVVRPLQEETIEQARPLVRTLFLAVAVVLLIACANLAGLLLVRAIRQQRERALRQALGAPAWALLRSAFFESLTLSLSGGLLGILLAGVALDVGKRLLPESLPRIGEIGLNWEVVGFALLLAVITGLLCGLAPAFAALRTNVNETLKEGGRSGAAGGRHARLRSVLVVAEIAVALVLLTASGLLLRSFEKMRSTDLGFRPQNVTSTAYSLPRKQYATQAAVDNFNKELLLRLRQIPGVVATGRTSSLPASGANSLETFVVDGLCSAKGRRHEPGESFRGFRGLFPRHGDSLAPRPFLYGSGQRHGPTGRHCESQAGATLLARPGSPGEAVPHRYPGDEHPVADGSGGDRRRETGLARCRCEGAVLPARGASRSLYRLTCQSRGFERQRRLYRPAQRAPRGNDGECPASGGSLHRPATPVDTSADHGAGHLR